MKTSIGTVQLIQSSLFLGTSASSISTGLYTPGTIQAAMYDFDKTMVINSFGEKILTELCDPNCSYEACNCTGVDDLANALLSSDDPQALVLETFGGQDRLDRLDDHFKALSDGMIDLYIVSTSWYLVPAEAWAKFIFETLKIAGLDEYFPLEKILPLDDPGEGVAADKGAVIRAKLSELNLEPFEAIFSDDSEGNFLSAVQGMLSAETIYVQPRTGLSEEALVYIEGRSNMSTEASIPIDQTGPFETTITNELAGGEKEIQAVMYDFDKTMVINSFGEKILTEFCDPNCSYQSCNCTGVDDLANALLSSDDPQALVLETFGGQDRLDRLDDHFKALSDGMIDLYIVSTSWYLVPAEAWAKFIFETLKIAGLDEYFPLEKILPLDDPGEGVAADKGAVIRAKLSELNLEPFEAIFSDDSEGNFLSAVQEEVSAETIYVQPRTGLSEEALVYIERRSGVYPASSSSVTGCPIPNMALIMVGALFLLPNYSFN